MGSNGHAVATGEMEMVVADERPAAAYLDIASARQNMALLKTRHNMLVEVMRDVLVEGTDYGKIPGTGDKPALYKSGAETLSFLFGLRPTFTVVDCVENWEQGLFYYRYRCMLHDAHGGVVCDSEGSCNSRETKYRYRTAKMVCPVCGADTVSRSKFPPRSNPNAPKGWWCRSCKTDFAHDDKRITEQEMGKVENPEPFELVNTLQKMAQKRALVAAVLVGAGASRLFTQDVEDMSMFDVEGTFHAVDTPQEQPKAQPAQPKPPTTPQPAPDPIPDPNLEQPHAGDAWDREAQAETQGELTADLPDDLRGKAWHEFRDGVARKMDAYKGGNHVFNALKGEFGADYQPWTAWDDAEAEKCWQALFERKQGAAE